MSAADAAVIDGYATEVMKQVPDLPGMWLGVWDPEKGFYSAAYGEAVKGGEKAALDQHGRIGSVTKTFTTTAILQQVAAGALKLESTIGEILPDLATRHPAIKDITVEQLAGMTSGIPDYANTGVVIEQVVADPQRVFTVDELVDAAMTLPLSAPGTGGYSTTNTLILGQMLEKLTGKPVEQVVTELAASVGMSQTALQAPDQVVMPDPSSHGDVESDEVAKELDLPQGGHRCHRLDGQLGPGRRWHVLDDRGPGQVGGHRPGHGPAVRRPRRQAPRVPPHPGGQGRSPTAWASRTSARGGSATRASSSAGSRSCSTTRRPVALSWPS